MLAFPVCPASVERLVVAHLDVQEAEVLETCSLLNPLPEQILLPS
jgi:hypothetical protein